MKKVLQQLGQYRKDTFQCIFLTALEVVMEILLPFVTAIIIDQGLEAGNLPVVYRYGILMVAMAFFPPQPDFRRAGRKKGGQGILGAGGQPAGSHLRQYPDLFLFQY